ncbi:ABC transporter permease [Nonomuraea sp. NPDC050394]|uniref:ABC transporter permease n=1 Tax=Nonomuraea sp. NPDC050394 TaxID=3364363 RepID=UPI0037AC92C6
MNATTHAVKLGLARGWIEFRHSLTSSTDMYFNAFISVAFVVVLYFQREVKLPGTNLSLAAATLPSMLALLVAVGGLVGTVGTLAVEREDGTLLRAKAMPHGMTGYLIGRIVSTSTAGLVTLVIVLAAGLILVPSMLGTGLGGWLMFAWVIVLGLLATLPLGAVVGSLTSNPQAAAGFSMLTVGALTSASGIFYPITSMPEWLQTVSQIFPLYWLGLGMRSAFLPDAAAAAEIGQSWRVFETTGVLGLWALAGLLLAPPILRRMAKRESGSLVQERRERAMQRVS